MKEKEYRLKTLFWEATLRCNAFCEFCGSRCGEVSCNEISGEKIEKVFEDIADAYNPGSIMINVTGGEPILRKDLFEVMTKASAMGFPWGMVSNGSLIDKCTIQKMKQSGMKTISISLDGMEETHNRLRKIENGFQKTVQAIKDLKQAAFLNQIEVTTVVNHYNIEQLEEMYSMIKSFGIDSWRVAVADSIGRAKENQELLLGKREFQQYCTFLDRHRFDTELRIITSCSHYLGKNDNKYRANPFSCETGKSVASILANGDIFVCPNVERRKELIQGNVQKDNFVEVWENKFEFFRSETRCQSKKCKTCKDWESCRGDSLHTWNFEKKEPSFCIKDYMEDIFYSKELPMELIKKMKSQVKDRMIGIKISSKSQTDQCVYFSPNASEELFYYFHFGKKHPRNMDELMAGLVGHVINDNIVLVEFIVPIELDTRSSDKAVFSNNSYNKLQEELKIMNKARENCDEELQLFSSELQLVGTIHSHPGNLRTIMSIPDMGLHKYLSEHIDTYKTTTILNAQKRQIASYGDTEFCSADIIFLEAEQQIARWNLVK